MAVPDGSNEIAVIPDLLKALDLAGAIVTIDAAGCQKENAQRIRDGGGHYLLCVKANQPGLLQAVQAVFTKAEEAGYEAVAFDHHAQSDKGHGRNECRSVAVIYAPEGLPAGWPDVKAVVEVVRQREVGGVSTTTCHHSLSSHGGTALEAVEKPRPVHNPERSGGLVTREREAPGQGDSHAASVPQRPER